MPDRRSGADLAVERDPGRRAGERRWGGPAATRQLPAIGADTTTRSSPTSRDAGRRWSASARRRRRSGRPPISTGAKNPGIGARRRHRGAEAGAGTDVVAAEHDPRARRAGAPPPPTAAPAGQVRPPASSSTRSAINAGSTVPGGQQPGEGDAGPRASNDARERTRSDGFAGRGTRPAADPREVVARPDPRPARPRPSADSGGADGAGVQVAGRHAARKAAPGDRAGRRPDDHVGGPGVPARRLGERSEDPGVPRAAGDPARAEHQRDAGRRRAHRRNRRANWGPWPPSSTAHCQPRAHARRVARTP